MSLNTCHHCNAYSPEKYMLRNTIKELRAENFELKIAIRKVSNYLGATHREHVLPEDYDFLTLVVNGVAHD